MDRAVALLSVAVAAAVLVRLYSRGGFRNVLFIVAAFFALFAYGPVLNLLVGSPVYQGIDVEFVPQACIGFALAMAAMGIGDQLFPQRQHFDERGALGRERVYPLLPLLFIVLIAYASLSLTVHLPELLATRLKPEKVAVAGPLHYRYLLAEIAAVSTFFMTRPNTLLRRLWMANLAVYVVYSLLTDERDFLLVIFAVLVHREMLSNKRRAIKFAGAALALVLVATYLYSARSNQAVTTSGIFNQGSILFVDSYLHHRQAAGWLPDWQWGSTYVHSLVSWLHLGNHESLSAWLVRVYAPGSSSGYGFSMTGEAYLNLGWLGIPVVFLVLVAVHRHAVNRADRSDWWAYFSVLLTTEWMYGMRSDSTQLATSLIVGAAAFAILRATSVRQSRTRYGRSSRALTSAVSSARH